MAKRKITKGIHETSLTLPFLLKCLYQARKVKNNLYACQWVRARLCKLQKGCTRLAAASDKVYQLLAHGRWFSPGTPASSTIKTGRHDIAEILLKVALKHQKSKSSTRHLPMAGCFTWSVRYNCTNKPGGHVMADR